MRRFTLALLSCITCLCACAEVAPQSKPSANVADTSVGAGDDAGTHPEDGGVSARDTGAGGADGSAAAPREDTRDSGASVPQAPTPVEGVGVLGARCDEEGSRSCVGRDSMRSLRCTAGVWVAGPECVSNQRCDTAPGPTRGTCQVMLSLCTGRQAGDAVCDGFVRRKCGHDLVRFEDYACPEHAHCEGPQAQCACDVGFELQGEGCRARVTCPAGACTPGGTCVPGETDYSCQCSPDYEGTGTKSCALTGRCAEPNVCSAEYTCRNRDTTYVCLGQFADWPMPSRGLGANTAPSYTLLTDTVVDGVTQLIWQRNVPESVSGCGSTCTWDKAKAYCESLELDGASDWRLPTRIELVSILDDEAIMPSIDAEAFPNTPSQSFWTASIYAGESSRAWVVAFGAFQSIAQAKTSGHRVRCVR